MALCANPIPSISHRLPRVRACRADVRASQYPWRSCPPGKRSGFRRIGPISRGPIARRPEVRQSVVAKWRRNRVRCNQSTNRASCRAEPLRQSRTPRGAGKLPCEAQPLGRAAGRPDVTRTIDRSGRDHEHGRRRLDVQERRAPNETRVRFQLASLVVDAKHPLSERRERNGKRKTDRRLLIHANDPLDRRPVR